VKSLIISCLPLAACASAHPAVERAEGLLDELRPQVVQMIGHDRGVVPQVCVSSEIDRLALVAHAADEVYLVLHPNWLDQPPYRQRFVIAHELTHLCAPQRPFPLSEGLADLVASQLVPQLEPIVWTDHWVVLSDADLVPGALIRHAPRSDSEEDELRAYGFFALLRLMETHELHSVAQMDPQAVVTGAPSAPELTLIAADTLRPDF